MINSSCSRGCFRLADSLEHRAGDVVEAVDGQPSFHEVARAVFICHGQISGAHRRIGGMAEEDRQRRGEVQGTNPDNPLAQNLVIPAQAGIQLDKYSLVKQRGFVRYAGYFLLDPGLRRNDGLMDYLGLIHAAANLKARA